MIDHDTKGRELSPTPTDLTLFALSLSLPLLFCKKLSNCIVFYNLEMSLFLTLYDSEQACDGARDSSIQLSDEGVNSGRSQEWSKVPQVESDGTKS